MQCMLVGRFSLNSCCSCAEMCSRLSWLHGRRNRSRTSPTNSSRLLPFFFFVFVVVVLLLLLLLLWVELLLCRGNRVSEAIFGFLVVGEGDVVHGVGGGSCGCGGGGGGNGAFCCVRGRRG